MSCFLTKILTKNTLAFATVQGCPAPKYYQYKQISRRSCLSADEQCVPPLTAVTGVRIPYGTPRLKLDHIMSVYSVLQR